MARKTILAMLALVVFGALPSCRPNRDVRGPDNGDASQPERHSIPIRAALSETRPKNERIHLRATVQDIALLSSFSGTVTPVHIDPRFALTVRVESTTPDLAGFAPGSVVTFAIHSPSMLFAGEDAKGKTYDFTMVRKSEQGGVRYSVLSAVAGSEVNGTAAR